MRCNVCDQDKEPNQFQTYFHSTQNKMRTRRQCTECLYKIRMKRKDPDKFYENNPDYHKCNTCSEWKLVSEYYMTAAGKIYSNRCRACTKIVDAQNRHKKLSNNCGSDKVKTNPNQYTDKYQKECTFYLMETLGYIYDEPTGIWIKEGYKEIRDGKPYFPNIKPTYRTNRKVTPTKLDRVINLRQRGLSYEQIAEELEISDTTVYKIIKKWKSQSK